MARRQNRFSLLILGLLFASAGVGLGMASALADARDADVVNVTGPAAEAPAAPILPANAAVLAHVDDEVSEYLARRWDPEELQAHLEKEWDPVAGREIYNGTCVACHGDDGTGAVPGAPDFTQQLGPLFQSDAVLMAHIELGLDHMHSLIAMPPKGGDESLTMEDIMNVLEYLHMRFHYNVEF